MAQSLKCSLCTHKDLSLDSQHPYKRWAWKHAPVTPVLEVGRSAETGGSLKGTEQPTYFNQGAPGFFCERY